MYHTLFPKPGIVIKHENMEYKRAVQLAHLVLDLLAKVKRSVRTVCEPPDVRPWLGWFGASSEIGGVARSFSCPEYQPISQLVAQTRQNEVESVRLKAKDYELLVGQSGSYTLAIVQQQGSAASLQLPYHHQQQQQAQVPSQQQPAKGAGRPSTPATAGAAAAGGAAGGSDGAANAKALS